MRHLEKLGAFFRGARWGLGTKKGGDLNGEREGGAGRPEATFQQAKNKTKNGQKQKC